MLMRKGIAILLVIVLLMSLVSCSTKNEHKGNETVIVTDMLGEHVEVKKNPSKVACVSRTTYDLLVAFGLGDKIDGAYKTIYDNSWTEVIYPASSNEYHYEYEESYETFLARGVDIVFAPEKYIADGLKEHGIAALNVSLYGNPTFDEYVFFFANLVKQIWDDPQVTAKVDAWKNKVETAISSIQTELAKHNLPEQKIMYVRGDKNKGIGYTDNVGSFTEYAFRVMGFDFAGSHFENNKPSKEAIMAYEPDAFVIGGIYQNVLVDTLKTDEVYANLEAVKENRIYTIPVGLTMFEQLSAMTPIFFYDMANKIYPEYFNFDIETLVKETIQEYFGTELTDLQIGYMLTGKDYQGNNLAQ